MLNFALPNGILTFFIICKVPAAGKSKQISIFLTWSIISGI